VHRKKIWPFLEVEYVKTVGVGLEPIYKEMREDGEKKVENDMWAVVGWVGLTM